MSGHQRSAREAPREHGLAAGALVGAWAIRRTVETLVRQMKGEKSEDMGAPPEGSADIVTMSHQTVTHQTRTVAALAELSDLIARRQLQ